jgi:hypothetical protein
LSKYGPGWKSTEVAPNVSNIVAVGDRGVGETVEIENYLGLLGLELVLVHERHGDGRERCR